MELILLGSLLAVFAVYFSIKDTVSDVLHLKTSLNPYYSPEKIDLLTNIFFEEWVKAYPLDESNFRKALSRVFIRWETNRILFDSKIVMAIMEKPTLIRIWVGPRLKNGDRQILFTGFLDQLAKLALLSNQKDVITDSPEIRGIISNAARQFKLVYSSRMEEDNGNING